MGKIIAIDTSPIDKNSTSQHKVRGVGKYISLLKDNLERFDSSNKYIFTNNPKQLIENVDIIHYPYFDPFFVTLPLLKKVKTFVTVHDIIPLVHKKHFPVGVKGEFKWKLNRLLLKQVDGIITDSNASKEDISVVTGINKTKIHVVYLSVEDNFIRKDLSDGEKEHLEKKYGIPDRFFLYVGDVTWNKNLPRLIAAVKKSNVSLVMVGKALADSYDTTNSWNNDRNKVMREIADDPRFLRLGFVPTEDLVDIYNIATALCMPSIDEGFGLPVLEAMRSGCPVISARTGSLPEIGGEAVFYIDAENIDSIVHGITEIENNKVLREELVVKASAQSVKFTTEKMIRETIATYNS